MLMGTQVLARGWGGGGQGVGGLVEGERQQVPATWKGKAGKRGGGWWWGAHLLQRAFMDSTAALHAL